MDNMKKKSLQEKLATSRRYYVEKLPSKMEEIEKSWQLIVKKPWNEGQFETLHRRVHTLAGSAGIFGHYGYNVQSFPTLSHIKKVLKQTTPAIISTALNNADDSALYEAKEGGRNQVVLPKSNQPNQMPPLAQ
jgi:hypothetical protein